MLSMFNTNMPILILICLFLISMKSLMNSSTDVHPGPRGVRRGARGGGPPHGVDYPCPITNSLAGATCRRPCNMIIPAWADISEGSRIESYEKNKI